MKKILGGAILGSILTFGMISTSKHSVQENVPIFVQSITPAANAAAWSVTEDGSNWSFKEIDMKSLTVGEACSITMEGVTWTYTVPSGKKAKCKPILHAFQEDL